MDSSLDRESNMKLILTSNMMPQKYNVHPCGGWFLLVLILPRNGDGFGVTKEVASTGLWGEGCYSEMKSAESCYSLEIRRSNSSRRMSDTKNASR